MKYVVTCNNGFISERMPYDKASLFRHTLELLGNENVIIRAVEVCLTTRK